MKAGLKNKGILDPQECWRLWCEKGSLPKAREELRKRGRINPKTNDVPNASAIQKSAYSWVLQHPEETRKDLAFAWMQEGVVLTDERWRQFLVDKAGLVYYQQPRVFDAFIEKNGLQDLVE